MALGLTLEELNKLLEEKKKKIAALPKPITPPGKIGKPIQPLPSPQQIAAQQINQAFQPAPTPPQPDVLDRFLQRQPPPGTVPRPLSAGPAFDLAPAQVEPIRRILGPTGGRGGDPRQFGLGPPLPDQSPYRFGGPLLYQQSGEPRNLIEGVGQGFQLGGAAARGFVSGALDVASAQARVNAETDRFFPFEAADVAGAALVGGLAGGTERVRERLAGFDLPSRIIQREIGAPPRPGSEQAQLGPVAQVSAWFSGTSGEAWQLGAFYRGIDPEDRDPPAIVSEWTRNVLTNEYGEEELRVSPEDFEEVYVWDPVTGFWIRRSPEEEIPLTGGFGGFGGFGRGAPRFSFGGGGGFGGFGPSAPRAPSMGLVNWRI